MKQVHGIWLPDNDTHFEEHLKKSVYFDGRATYQFNKIKAAIDQVPERTGTAIDIGAHVGLWSRVLQKYFPQVVAFEPVPAHIECFEKNLAEVLRTEHDPFGHVILYERALGNEHTTVLINPTVENTGNAHVETVKFEDSPFLEVEQHRLDDYVFTNVSLIKIDVEGYEMEVIKGALATIKNHKPVIVVEQKPGHARRYGYHDTEAVEFLKKLGMKVNWVMAGDYCLSF